MATCKDCFHWCICQGEGIYYSEGAEGCSSFARELKWISVTERLPEEQSEARYNIVLTRTQDGKRVVKLGYWDGYHKRFYGFDKPSNYCVTHWMPLPEPPEMKENKEEHG